MNATRPDDYDLFAKSPPHTIERDDDAVIYKERDYGSTVIIFNSPFREMEPATLSQSRAHIMTLISNAEQNLAAQAETASKADMAASRAHSRARSTRETVESTRRRLAVLKQALIDSVEVPNV